MKYRSQIAAVLVIVAMTAATAEARSRRQDHEAQIRFLAASTLIRETWGQNEDAYLAQVLAAHGGESYLIRLVDTYPNEAPPLSRTAINLAAVARDLIVEQERRK